MNSLAEKRVLVARVNYHFYRKEYSTCLETAKEILEKYPLKDLAKYGPELLETALRCSLKLKKYEDALKYSNEVFSRFGGNRDSGGSTAFMHAEVLMKLGKLDGMFLSVLSFQIEALTYAQEALTRNSRLVLAWKL